jgi:hypothetical protein
VITLFVNREPTKRKRLERRKERKAHGGTKKEQERERKKRKLCMRQREIKIGERRKRNKVLQLYYNAFPPIYFIRTVRM